MLALAVAAPAAEASPAGDPRVAPVHAHSHGRTYGEWAAAWWQWALSVPAPVNPLIDETGENCGQGQSGSVWFLAGNFGGTTVRECTVPAGKALFVPMVNNVWIQFLTDPAFSIEELRAFLSSTSDGAVLTAELDGVPVRSPASYRATSPVFTVELPDDNLMGVDETLCARNEAGTLACHPGLDDGYYLLIKPLPPGPHTLRFTAAMPSGFAVDVTYHLNVGG